MNKKTLGFTAIITGLLLSASAAFADGQLRGGMTAVRNVAGSINNQNQYADIKWQSGRTVSSASVAASGNSDASFKWADRNSHSRGNAANMAQNASALDGNEAGVRWVIRNDAEQSGVRWVIRNDAEQSGVRWVIRNDADQSGVRWVIRNDADQSGVRWVIRNDAEQSGVRWVIRNDASQADLVYNNH